MLAWAGLGVAVGHAIESVKAVVNFVGPETEDPGSAFAAAVTAVLSSYNGKSAKFIPWITELYFSHHESETQGTQPDDFEA